MFETLGVFVLGGFCGWAVTHWTQVKAAEATALVEAKRLQAQALAAKNLATTATSKV